MTLDVAAMFAEHHAFVVNYLRRRLNGRDPSIADDLACDTFLRAWEKRDQYVERAGTPARAWLVRIAHNLLIDYLRHERPTANLDDLQLAAVESAPNHRADVLPLLPAAIAALTPRQRAVIVARFYHGYRQRELGHISTYAGVKKLQDRALVNLRRALDVA